MRAAMRAHLFVPVLVVLAAPAAAQDFGKLGFMAGCWQGQTGKDQFVEENWTPPAENLMLGVARTLTGKRATSWEFTVIEKTDAGVLFVSMPSHQPTDTFRLKVLASEVASFERGGSEFPGVIMYRLTGDKAIIIRLEAPPGISEPSIEIRMNPVRCPGR